jgi:hypothetical protein
MKTAFAVLRYFAALVVIFSAAGCGGDDSQQQQQQGANASSIPWNRPQSWEGQGMMGGFQQQQGSTGH